MSEPKLIQLAKGSISPEDIEQSGILTPAQSNDMLEAIKDNNAFLKEITYSRQAKLKGSVDAYDIADGSLVRVEEGVEPTDEQLAGMSNIGCALDMLNVQLFADVTFSTIRNNQYNTKFLTEMFQRFTTKFGNELVHLGFVGYENDNLDNEFARLNKGWVHLAQNSTDTKKATYAVDSKIADRLKALIDVVHDDVVGEAAIIMNPRDYQTYLLETGLDTAEVSLVVNAEAKSFLGYPIKVQGKMPQGVYMSTPLKNLAFGICNEIFRSQKWHDRKRVVQYTFDVACDYGIVIDKWAAICEQAV